MTRRTASDLDAIRAKAEWSVEELGAMFGRSGAYIRQHLVDANGHPVRVGDVPPDGRAWVRLRPDVLVPGKRNHNGHLRFLAAQVDAAVRTGLEVA